MQKPKRGEIITRRFLIERNPDGRVYRLYVEEQRRGKPFWRRVYTPTGGAHDVTVVLSREDWIKPPIDLEGIQIIPPLAITGVDC